jgi:hypothetical protein
MESLQPEVAPFDIHTTIVNPGFFRTELLTKESVTYAQPSLDDYADRTAEQLKWWEAQNRQQPGDPAKLGRALVTITSEEPPPRRFIAGADAMRPLAVPDAGAQRHRPRDGPRGDRDRRRRRHRPVGHRGPRGACLAAAAARNGGTAEDARDPRPIQLHQLSWLLADDEARLLVPRPERPARRDLQLSPPRRQSRRHAGLARSGGREIVDATGCSLQVLGRLYDFAGSAPVVEIVFLGCGTAVRDPLPLAKIGSTAVTTRSASFESSGAPLRRSR